jgi:hypothetical protein
MTRPAKGFLLLGLLVALLLAGVVSHYASNEPDGLNRVAADQGFARGQHDPVRGPLAGYSVKGIANGRLSSGLAGVAGVGLTFLIAATVTVAVRRRSARADRPSARSRDEDLTGQPR